MKAVIFEKSSEKIIGVITNVKNYSETEIHGDSVIQGLSPEVDYILLEDDVLVEFEQPMFLQNTKMRTFRNDKNRKSKKI
jgi:hypothetical protein